MFKFGLNQFVEISISGEMGHVKGRGEWAGRVNAYEVHYKTADGRMDEKWIDEDDLSAVKDDDDGGPIFIVKKGESDLPKGGYLVE